ncbi:arginase family protein [Streptomyces humi]|uniref:arginase family protein n=1 Tax=Streptomyces humi TaxID=1428620 RepID=UPI0006288B19|nr:arginase family protein [Streptomyces humi]
MSHISASGDASRVAGDHLRLLWPQWQGAGAAVVEELAPEFPLGIARRGYAVGTTVLEAVLPPHQGPTATVPVTMSDDGLEERDGVEAKAVVLKQLASALEVIRRHDPARITTLGGECAVSVAPFAALAHRYGDDLAVIWIDSHPDIGTPDSAYKGYHAMAVAALTGHGDPDVQGLLPATVAADRLALVGLHEWTDDDFPNIAAWGIRSYSPDRLRASTEPLLDWVRATGCTRVAVHFDVDTIDSDEAGLGLGFVPGGLTSSEVRRIVADIGEAADVVGLTIAEFVPRQVMHLQRIVSGFPLLQHG